MGAGRSSRVDNESGLLPQFTAGRPHKNLERHPAGAAAGRRAGGIGE